MHIEDAAVGLGYLDRLAGLQPCTTIHLSRVRSVTEERYTHDS